MLGSFSGSTFVASNVPSRSVLKAWAASVNDAGGLQGHPVELVVKDDALSPANAVSAVKDLASQHVAAIMSVSALSAAWASTASDLKIPVVGTLSSDATFQSNPDFYPEASTNDASNAGVVAIGKQAGATNLGVMYCAESPICANLATELNTVGTPLGVPVVYKAQIAATAPNYTAECLAAKKAGATALLVGQGPATFIRVAADCARQNYNPIYLAVGNGNSQQMFTATGLKDKLWALYPSMPFFADTPNVKDFNAVMDKYAPGVRDDKVNFVENSFLAWVSGKLLERALDAGGLTASTDATPELVTKGLASLKNETLGGLAPPLTYEAGKPHTVPCYFGARVQNGVPSVIDDGKAICPAGS